MPALSFSYPERDVLDDGVAMAVLVGQRHQDVESGGRQRQQRVNLFAVDHAFYYSHGGYMFNGYRRKRRANGLFGLRAAG